MARNFMDGLLSLLRFPDLEDWTFGDPGGVSSRTVRVLSFNPLVGNQERQACRAPHPLNLR